jgi:hypothetical protein
MHSCDFSVNVRLRWSNVNCVLFIGIVRHFPLLQRDSVAVLWADPDLSTTAMKELMTYLYFLPKILTVIGLPSADPRRQFAYLGEILATTTRQGSRCSGACKVVAISCKGFTRKSDRVFRVPKNVTEELDFPVP